MCRKLTKDQKHTILDKVIETANGLERHLDELFEPNNQHIEINGDEIKCHPKTTKK